MYELFILATIILIWTNMYREWSSRVYGLDLIIRVKSIVIVVTILFIIVELFIGRFIDRHEWYIKYCDLYHYGITPGLFTFSGLASILLWLNMCIIPLWKQCYINHHYPRYDRYVRKIDYVLIIVGMCSIFNLLEPTVILFHNLILPLDKLRYLYDYSSYDGEAVTWLIISFIGRRCMNYYLIYTFNKDLAAAKE